MTMRKRAAKNVERIREEIRFIKRYISFHNKKKTPKEILAFIKSLQRSIIQKLIRKSSPFAREIEIIQNHLIAIYNSLGGNKTTVLHVKNLPRMVSIVGGEKIYPSVSIIKRFIGLQGKYEQSHKFEAFVTEIEKAAKNKKILKDDPYVKELEFIYSKLKRRIGNTISVSNQELHGLEGIVKACSCNKSLGQIHRIKKDKARKIKGLRPCRKKTYTDSKNRGACSHNGGLNGVLTAEEMANRHLDLLPFDSIWQTLFGRPGENFSMMFHGEPGNGKTILLLKFSQYLAEMFGRVLYISSEEFSSPTMTKKVQDFLSPRPERLHFAESLEQPDLSQYDFIILDSVNHLKLKESDYDKLRATYPNAAFIFILQHTKGGYFKGGKDWEHNAEIVGEVVKGVINISKNRYAPNNSLDFFKYFGIQWKEKDATQEESLIVKSAPKPYPIKGEITIVPEDIESPENISSGENIDY